MESEAIAVIKCYILESPELFFFQGKYVVEIELLEYICNWKERYFPLLGDFETFLTNQPTFRVISDTSGSKLIRQRTDQSSDPQADIASPSDLQIIPQDDLLDISISHASVVELQGTEDHIFQTPSEPIGKRVQDFFRLPSLDVSERGNSDIGNNERIYLAALNHTQASIEKLVKRCGSSFFGNFVNHGTKLFEENEWLGMNQ